MCWHFFQKTNLKYSSRMQVMEKRLVSIYLSVYNTSHKHTYDCINLNMNLFHKSTVNRIISVQQIMESFSRNLIGIRIVQFLTFRQFHNMIKPTYHKIMPNVSGMISDFSD